ncbi:hypothetical protein B0H13DRAFT_2009120 [Mycena leptocephala]|nr:hypothetical protein B0H13DRAFT_2009120 [Mycena leptocephala]
MSTIGERSEPLLSAIWTAQKQLLSRRLRPYILGGLFFSPPECPPASCSDIVFMLKIPILCHFPYYLIPLLTNHFLRPTLHTTHSSTSLPSSPIHTTNAKLAAAQTELQACEAHLAAKEAALGAHRAALVREGLAGRCRALAECGQRWSEAGRAGAVTAQGSVDAQSSPDHPQHAVSDPNKPLPGVAGSDLSLAPSQSASQINLFAEPQHIYSDATLPPPSSQSHESSSNHDMPPAPIAAAMTLPPAAGIPLLPFSRRALSHRITEEDLVRTPYGDDDQGSSAGEEEPTGPLEVVENPRFATAAAGAKGGLLKREGTLKREAALTRRQPTATLRQESTYGGSTLSVPVKSNSGFFGSIRGLFGRRGGSDIGAGGRRRWGKGKEDDAESEEPDVRSEPPMPMPRARARVVSDVGSRRRRGMTEDSARKAEEWIGGQGLLLSPTDVEEKGWASDGGTTPTSTLVKRKKSKSKGTVRSGESTIRSVASSAASDSTAEVLVLSPRHKRRASLGITGDSASAEALVPSVPGGKTTARTERRASMPVHPAPRLPTQTVSLMSIVEDVARANRDGWAGHNSNGNGGSVAAGGSANGSGGLVDVKAPRPDGSTLRGRTMSVGATLEGLPRAPGSVFLTSGSLYSTPAVPPTFSGPEMLAPSGTSSAGSSVKRPAKSPLRSAMRTASPPPAPAPPAVPVKAPLPAAVPVPIPVPAPKLAPVINGIVNENGKGKGKAVESEDDSDDAASIASWRRDGARRWHETEHEEEHGKPPPPPPHEYGNGTVLHDSPVDTSNLIEDYGFERRGRRVSEGQKAVNSNFAEGTEKSLRHYTRLRLNFLW